MSTTTRSHKRPIGREQGEEGRGPIRHSGDHASSTSTGARSSGRCGASPPSRKPVDPDPYSFALWNGEDQLVTVATAYSGLEDGEIPERDRWIRSHTTERCGPVRALQPVQVFDQAFEGLQHSVHPKGGIAVRIPRINRWREDRTAADDYTLASALVMLK